MYVIWLIKDELNQSLDCVADAVFFILFFPKRQSGDDEIQLQVWKHVAMDGALTKPTTLYNLVFLMFHCITHKMRMSVLVTNSTDKPSRG